MYTGVGTGWEGGWAATDAQIIASFHKKKKQKKKNLQDFIMFIENGISALNIGQSLTCEINRLWLYIYSYTWAWRVVLINTISNCILIIRCDKLYVYHCSICKTNLINLFVGLTNIARSVFMIGLGSLLSILSGTYIHRTVICCGSFSIILIRCLRNPFKVFSIYQSIEGTTISTFDLMGLKIPFQLDLTLCHDPSPVEYTIASKSTAVDLEKLFITPTHNIYNPHP